MTSQGTLKEVHALVSLMIQELSSTRVSTKTLGNGEVVCVIDKTTNIWNREDWEQWWQQSKAKQEKLG